MNTPRREEYQPRSYSRREISRKDNPMFYSGQISTPRMRSYSVKREPKITIIGENTPRGSVIHGDMGTSHYIPSIIDKRVHTTTRQQ